MLLLIIVGEANASEFPSMNTAFEFYFLISNQLAVVWGGNVALLVHTIVVAWEDKAALLVLRISAAWGRKRATAKIQLQRRSSSAGTHATGMQKTHATGKVFPSSDG